MKTYEEMAQSALARGKAIRKERKKNNTIMLGSLSALVVCCVVVLLVFGMGETADGPLNYGQISYLSSDHKIGIDKTGKGFQYITGTANPGGGISSAPPQFEFQREYIHVVAKAIEEVGIYETLNAYGSTQT